jgi:prephenate dehydratase
MNRRTPATVHYLGPAGTFSHVLARKHFGVGAELKGCQTVDQVVTDTLASPGSFGLVPVENSSGGTVYDSVDLLIGRADALRVVEELSLDVRIALLRRAGGPLSVVYSHFTQLKHHAAWLRERHPGARLVAVESTAVAAARASSSPRAAALSSPGAAPIYGLGIAEKPPSAKTANVTHFYVVASAEAPASVQDGPSMRTALVATLPNVCGSLHAFLGPFARRKVSLSRIVSRPVPGKPQTYVFFVEIEGAAAESAAGRALKDAGRLAESLVSLGSFPCGRRYKS